MANRLADVQSPYLRQHADNPVDWYPWGEAAFAKARAEGKPIFLSVGYSTCHWCHVMAHESFEHADTAALMNRHFVNIKVDREERPDVDRVYMSYVQAATGRGGWPMSVFLTPQLKPFHGGTYYPPDDRHGVPGFPRLLGALAEAWQDDRPRIEERASEILGVLERELVANHHAADVDRVALATGLAQAANQFDASYGGFGDAPKFPRAAGFDPLAAALALGGSDGERAREMLLVTLHHMAAGGIYDHLGGGFHRYSVDRFWHVPHYEKMLYDQGQLVVTYCEGYRIDPDPAFAALVGETLAYVDRDLSHPSGGFYAAEDADSLRPGASHPTEGAFYLWEHDEIDVELGDDAALFAAAYGVEPDGNSPPGSDPHGELRGYNTLIRRHSDAELAQERGLDAAAVAERLAAARQRLFALREGRPRPHRDDKIVTAWNGLMISGFACAGRVFDQPAHVARAARAIAFLKAELWDAERRVLRRSWLDQPAPVDGMAQDYAFLIQGLLDSYEAGLDPEHLRWAVDLQRRMDALFWDGGDGAWFDTTDDDPSILLRLKEDYDGAEPAATSVAVRNCWRLGAMIGDAGLSGQASVAARAMGETLAKRPWALAGLAASLPALDGAQRTVVVVGERDGADTRALCRSVATRHQPFTVLLHLDESPATAWLREGAAHLAAMTTIDGAATAYLCEGFICQEPTTDPQRLAQQLAGAGS